ncbi:hypothetical protein H0274_03345 [Altererythrobacter sp. CC-YST694]|uniref:hypothetical protein n=1 Tax=Altererythrobacter sp. CC-YST694 TaxID=2755038 RepID=UPI001D01B384|nr:hypothetical protein [Altererythrobacter sp. CC-YST694]MCB5424284.1 hypothetical protein [Altererythrobacter sp. CC-YST694]
MRLLLISAAALGLFATAPAQAATQEALRCPIQIAPAAVARKLADAMSVREPTPEEGQALEQAINSLVDACRSVHDIPDEREEDYLSIALSGIVMVRLAADLEEAGLPPSYVEDAMDVGEGRGNVLADEVSEEVIAKLLERLEKNGIDHDSIDSSVWMKVGAYAACTSAYYTLAGAFN